jgi:hypothetical protein
LIISLSDSAGDLQIADKPNYLSNFNTLSRAFQAGDVVLVECWPSGIEAQGAIICAVNHLPDGGRELVPFAQMLDSCLEPLVLPPSDGPSSPFSVN